MSLRLGLDYGAMRPAIKGSGAMGNLMRKKLAPVLGPVRLTLPHVAAVDTAVSVSAGYCLVPGHSG